MIQTSSTKCRYRVDATDVLTWVDDWWLAFARENGASELTEQRVLGHILWDFIADGTTRKLYQGIHSRVRSTCNTIVLPFRCDSSTLRRHMRLTIVLEDSGHLLYEGVLTRAEPCSVMDVLDPSFPRSRDVLTICSCCKRALVEPSGWLEVEDAAARLGLFEKPKAPRLTYTVCRDCASVLSGTPGNGNAS
jgi:hypothetical protein